MTPQNFEEEMQKSVEFWGTTDPLIGLMTEDYGYMLETRKGAAEAERESERDDEKPEEEKYEEFHFSLAADEASNLRIFSCESGLGSRRTAPLPRPFWTTPGSRAVECPAPEERRRRVAGLWAECSSSRGCRRLEAGLGHLLL